MLMNYFQSLCLVAQLFVQNKVVFGQEEAATPTSWRAMKIQPTGSIGDIRFWEKTPLVPVPPWREPAFLYIRRCPLCGEHPRPSKMERLCPHGLICPWMSCAADIGTFARSYSPIRYANPLALTNWDRETSGAN